MTVTLDRNVEAFIGASRQLFINGQWVDAASGRTFETPNPATGETLARIADGIAGGDFNAQPDGGKACGRCDFNGLCDVGRVRIHDRKREDARIASFAAMREVD